MAEKSFKYIILGGGVSAVSFLLSLVKISRSFVFLSSSLEFRRACSDLFRKIPQFTRSCFESWVWIWQSLTDSIRFDRWDNITIATWFWNRKIAWNLVRAQINRSSTWWSTVNQDSSNCTRILNFCCFF